MRRSHAIVAVAVVASASVLASFATQRWFARPPPQLDRPERSTATGDRSEASSAIPVAPTAERKDELEDEPSRRPRAVAPERPSTPVLPRFGRVIDAQNGVAIAGATVGRPAFAPGGLLDRAIWSLQRFEGPTTTCRDDGRFEFPLSDGEWLVVSAEGYAPRPIAATKLGAVIADATAVQLERPARLRATVEFDGGKPAERIDVRVIDRVEGVRFVVEAATDARGEALLAGVTPGRELAIELADGFALLWRDPVGTEFRAGDGIVKKWQLGASAIVSGRVVDQHGEPVADATISAHVDEDGALDPREAEALVREIEERWGANRWGGGARRTDDDGRFLVGPMAAGTAFVAVGPREEEVLERGHGGTARFATLRAGDRSACFEFVVERGLAIRGRLVASDGVGRRGRVLVFLRGEDGAWGFVAGCESDESGRFALSGASRRSEAVVMAMAHDGSLATRRPVALRAEEEQALALAPAQSVVVGGGVDRVLFFRAQDLRRAEPFIVEETVEEGGLDVLRVLGLEAGRYDVALFDRTGRAAVVRGFVVGESGEQRLEPTLGPAGVVHWSPARELARRGGASSSISASVRIRVDGLLLVEDLWPSADGATRDTSSPLPPGELTIEHELSGRRWTKRCTLRAGEHLGVALPSSTARAPRDEADGDEGAEVIGTIRRGDDE